MANVMIEMLDGFSLGMSPDIPAFSRGVTSDQLFVILVEIFAEPLKK